jgi:hypothetical protein
LERKDQRGNVIYWESGIGIIIKSESVIKWNWKFSWLTSDNMFQEYPIDLKVAYGEYHFRIYA